MLNLISSVTKSCQAVSDDDSRRYCTMSLSHTGAPASSLGILAVGVIGADGSGTREYACSMLSLPAAAVTALFFTLLLAEFSMATEMK